jgi:hypothetical protein
LGLHTGNDRHDWVSKGVGGDAGCIRSDVGSGAGQRAQGGAEGDGGFGVGVDGDGAAEFGGDELGD